jgi:hypothetical protein
MLLIFVNNINLCIHIPTKIIKYIKISAITTTLFIISIFFLCYYFIPNNNTEYYSNNNNNNKLLLRRCEGLTILFYIMIVGYTIST